MRRWAQPQPARRSRILALTVGLLLVPSSLLVMAQPAHASDAGTIVSKTNQERAKRGLPANDEALAAMSDGLRRRLDAESTALFGTARLWDDGVIDPADTRMVLGLAISASLNAPIEESKFGVFRM